MTQSQTAISWHEFAHAQLLGREGHFKEAKASFIRVAESENHMVGAYIYVKEELQGFEQVLERSREGLGKYGGQGCQLYRWFVPDKKQKKDVGISNE